MTGDQAKEYLARIIALWDRSLPAYEFRSALCDLVDEIRSYGTLALRSNMNLASGSQDSGSGHVLEQEVRRIVDRHLREHEAYFESLVQKYCPKKP